MTLKLIASWIFGGALITTSSWILGNLNETVGVSDVSYIIAFFTAFALILVGGLAWINVAAATSKH
jgi:hypothetical protein